MLLAVVTQNDAASQAQGPTKDLLNLSGDIQKRVSPQWGAEGQVTAAPSKDPATPGLMISIQPGKAGYPGVYVKPGDGKWDLSAFGHVEARIVNSGKTAALLAIRVDNPGDWQKAPWNTEQTYLKPGERGTVTVIFGHQYGHQPGYALKPKEIVGILLFSEKADSAKSFRIESLVAGGPAGEKPPVDPASVRIKPAGGTLLGPGVRIDAAKQIEAQGVEAYLRAGGESLEIVFPAAAGQQWLALKPPLGRWDLTLATEVRVKLKNIGAAPLRPSVQLASNSGPTGLATADAPLAPGARQELVVSFIPAVPGKGAAVTHAGYYGNQPGTGTSFGSDAVGAVRITAQHAQAARLLLESITAAAPAAILPDWLGKRPPVEGDWVKTFDDEFDGPTIDQKKWNIYGPNWWDRASHWSKDNLVLGGGVARLRFERKRGYHNDNPNEKGQTLSGENQSDYACGYLDTYGKWVQRYGYFEARVKLPRVPGLWPTFWMVPDRGPAAGPQWKRGDTGNGGMELDIMEHLTRWGPYRYNIALHFDGYAKDHKSVGTPYNYVQADKDGFITPGLLWTPGATVFYCNGKEVWRWEGPRVSNVPSNFIIEMTTGGWDNNAVDDAQLPVDYLIDYVRVWQRKDLASSADGYLPAEKAGR